MPMDMTQYSKVTGRFQSFSGGDIDNDNIPDVDAYSGTGYIACSAKEIRVTGTDPRVIIPAPVWITVNRDGELFFDESPHVYLLAPGAHTNPPNFTYILRLKVHLGSYTTRYDSPFFVEPGIDTDIANALLIDEDPSKLVTRGPKGLSMYDIAIQEGKFVGTEAEFIDLFMSNNSGSVSLTPDPDNEGFFKTA